jgi:hypothetical protein
MSGYCPDCGNTLCICDEVTKATYPLRMKVKELEKMVMKMASYIHDEDEEGSLCDEAYALLNK